MVRMYNVAKYTHNLIIFVDFSVVVSAERVLSVVFPSDETVVVTIDLRPSISRLLLVELLEAACRQNDE